MSRRCVLDSYALLAFLHDEPGSQEKVHGQWTTCRIFLTVFLPAFLTLPLLSGGSNLDGPQPV